jgi:hypothetical protein
MNRRQKKLARVHEDKPLELPGAEPTVKSQHEYICEGCPSVKIYETGGRECSIYAFVPPYYIRQGCCYHNRPEVKAKKKVTRGQQKQGRNR